MDNKNSADLAPAPPKSQDVLTIDFSMYRQSHPLKKDAWQAALRGLLQHLQSMDQLLLGLWAMDPELPHPCQLAEASCR